MANELQALTKLAQDNAQGLAVLTKSLDTLITTLTRTPLGGHPKESDVYGQPFIRQGEDSMSSRGFSFCKAIGLLTGELQSDQAKVEVDISSRLSNVYCKELGSSGYTPAGLGAWNAPRGRMLAPLATSFMHENFVQPAFRREMKALIAAGTEGADMGEALHIRTKMLQGMGYSKKALSWLNENTGGALVAPPEMGELIELLRNKEALVNAGARVVPLPPQGRLKFPRQTAPSNTFWVGESSPIIESLIGTGEVTLQAKKLAVLIKAPNELIRFASPAAEALLRDDMTKSLALGLDLAGLEGLGGDNRPLGVINQQNVFKMKSSRPGNTGGGDFVNGPDIYRMVAAVEEQNAEFEAFVMRPKTLYKFYQLRADAISQGDAQGVYLFNLIREAGADTPAMLAGYPVVKSTQVSMTQSQGNASNLTYVVGGMWSDMLIGMFGAIEFAATTQGDSAFTNDQSWVRGILSADIALRHAAAFVVLSNLDTTL